MVVLFPARTVGGHDSLQQEQQQRPSLTLLRQSYDAISACRGSEGLAEVVNGQWNVRTGEKDCESLKGHGKNAILAPNPTKAL